MRSCVVSPIITSEGVEHFEIRFLSSTEEGEDYDSYVDVYHPTSDFYSDITGWILNGTEPRFGVIRP